MVGLLNLHFKKNYISYFFVVWPPSPRSNIWYAIRYSWIIVLKLKLFWIIWYYILYYYIYTIYYKTGKYPIFLRDSNPQPTLANTSIIRITERSFVNVTLLCDIFGIKTYKNYLYVGKKFVKFKNWPSWYSSCQTEWEGLNLEILICHQLSFT